MSATQVLICCGSGGVGKTTTSAALAIRLAMSGRRVAVLTIDPARRLADALAVGRVGNTAVEVPLPPQVSGTLHAMMLDPKLTFDEVVTRFAPNPEARQRILDNHVYQNVSARLAGAHEYMAMEKLLELVETGRWDVVVLDTPPTRHALDFLKAPEKMANLMDEGVMRWLVLPASRGGWRMIEKGSEILANILQRLVGERTITDIAEFFASFQSLWEGFRERSIQVRALLRAPTTQFFLVTTPAPNARAEALEFLGLLVADKMPFAGFLVNRCATAPVETEDPRFGAVPGGEATVAALGLLPARQRELVAVQNSALGALTADAPADSRLWKLPDQAGTVSDLDTLQAFAAHLPSPEALGLDR